MALTVKPDEFVLVHYDHREIVDIATDTLTRVGFPDRDVVVEVLESTPLRRVSVESLDPVTLNVESGAFEDPHKPRRLKADLVSSILAAVFLRVKDRLDGTFADAPPDASLDHAVRSAWEVYAVGRSGRAGFMVQRQKELYAFRNRHRFSDAADAVFEELWTAESLAWTDVQALSARANQ